MKNILAALLMALLGLIATVAAHAEVYASKTHGYTMEMPPGWEKTEFPDQDEGVVMVYHGPDGAVLIVRLVLESIDLGDDVVRDRVLNDFLWVLEDGGMEEIEIIDEGFTSLKAGEAYGMHYQYFLPNGIQVETVSTFITGPDRYFILSYAAVPPVYEKQIQDMAEILKSFRIFPIEQEKENSGRGGKYI